MKSRKNSADKGAGSGCMARLVRCSSLWQRVNHWWFWVSQIIGLGLVIYGNRLLNDSLQITIITVYFCSVNAYLGGLLTFEFLCQPVCDDRSRNPHNSCHDDGDSLAGAEISPLNDRNSLKLRPIIAADGMELLYPEITISQKKQQYGQPKQSNDHGKSNP